jgi:hypothetical protein
VRRQAEARVPLRVVVGEEGELVVGADLLQLEREGCRRESGRLSSAQTERTLLQPFDVVQDAGEAPSLGSGMARLDEEASQVGRELEPLDEGFFRGRIRFLAGSSDGKRGCSRVLDRQLGLERLGVGRFLLQFLLELGDCATVSTREDRRPSETDSADPSPPPAPASP